MEAARRATENDVPRLATLCRAALAELGARERGGALFVAREGRAEPLEESLRATVAGPASVAVAGTIDDTVVGFGTGRLEGLRDGSCLGVIDELFVEEGARAVGVGEAIMGELLAWFSARGCLGVDSTALPGARETKNFFEESGFTARLLVMHRRLRG
ncbi:MAG TPA: GNAT family N-acetyltransferase [Acidimicrobiales bacterium]|nr:GNAT family N-acetyltransferase [Acidimicrobiales bacterium]